MNFILTAANFIFPIVTFPYVSRILLAEGTGKVAFAASIASYFSMIAAWGIPTYGIRACARIRDDKDKLNILVIHSTVNGANIEEKQYNSISQKVLEEKGFDYG